MLLEKLPEYFDHDALRLDEDIARLIVNQFRWLDYLVDCEKFTDSLFKVLSICPCDLKREIIGSLPEVMGDSSNEIVVEALEQVLQDDSSATVAVIDCFSSLNLDEYLQDKVITITLSCIRTIEAEKLPYLLRFLLLSATQTNAQRIISEFREQYKLVGVFDTRLTQNNKLKGKSVVNNVEAYVLDALGSSLPIQKVPVLPESSLNRTKGSDMLNVVGLAGITRGYTRYWIFKGEILLTNIKEFYGIHDSFPFTNRLLTRNSDINHVKRIYYMSESVKSVVELNFLGGEQLKITSIGLKMFERQTTREGTSTPCVFRISSEGLPLLLPHMTKQIACATPVDFKHLLQYKSIKFPDLVDDGFREKVATLSLGCCVVVLNQGNEGLSDPPRVDKSTIAISFWKGRSSLSVMVTAIDCQELLERLLVRFETEKGSLPDNKLANGDEAVKTDDVEVMQDSETITLATTVG